MDVAVTRMVIDLGAAVHEVEQRLAYQRQQLSLAAEIDIKDREKFCRAFPRLAETLFELIEEQR